MKIFKKPSSKDVSNDLKKYNCLTEKKPLLIQFAASEQCFKKPAPLRAHTHQCIDLEMTILLSACKGKRKKVTDACNNHITTCPLIKLNSASSQLVAVQIVDSFTFKSLAAANNLRT